MDRNSNKIKDIVRLQQLLKKWKKLALTPKNNSATNPNSSKNNKSIKFLKKTLSFSESTVVPKGFFAVCVGEEMRRYVVPTECLSHVAFVDLLREAEEEFGFEQEGVLRIPCDVSVFETVISSLCKNKDWLGYSYCSAEAANGGPQLRPQKSLCR